MLDTLGKKLCATSQLKDGGSVKTKPLWTTGKSLSRPENFEFGKTEVELSKVLVSRLNNEQFN